jgi:hypothetical protein
MKKLSILLVILFALACEEAQTNQKPLRYLNSKDPFEIASVNQNADSNIIEINAVLKKENRTWSVSTEWSKVRKRARSCSLTDDKGEIFRSTDTYSDQCQVKAESLPSGNAKLVFRFVGIEHEQSKELIGATGEIHATGFEGLKLRFPLGLEPDLDDDDYLVRDIYPDPFWRIASHTHSSHEPAASLSRPGMMDQAGGLLLICVALFVVMQLILIGYNYIQIHRAKQEIRAERDRMAAWERQKPIDYPPDFR